MLVITGKEFLTKVNIYPSYADILFYQKFFNCTNCGDYLTTGY